MTELIKKFEALAEECAALKNNAGRKAAIKCRSAIEFLKAEPEQPKAIEGKKAKAE